MKYIDRLLQGAPVEWTTLEDTRFVELANRARRPVKASERIPGSIPYYGANNIQDYVDGYTHSGTYILLAEDGSASIDNYSIQWATGLFWANNHVHVLKVQGQLNSRFLYHYLKTVNYAPFLLGGERAKLTQKNLLRIPIPIPPVAVQEEVVRVLDKFTALEAELEAELDCRKRQYQYYRDALLTFDLSSSDGLCYSPLFPAPFAVEWLPLGEVFEMRNGYTPSKSNPAYWEGGTIPWFRMEDLRTSGRILEDSIQHITLEAVKGKGLFKAGSILMATTATIGEHALLVTDSLANQRFTNFEIHESLLGAITPMFAYYYFFLICEWCKRNVYESSFPSVDMKSLREVHFPIPPLAVQERIVEILDKFDTLVNSISEGLPREIELRRKQYEYYRDALLSFEPQTSNF